MDDQKGPALVPVFSMDCCFRSPPDEVHCARAVDCLSRLEPRHRPQTTLKFEAFLRRVGCCVYKVAVPATCIAAYVPELLGDSDDRLLDALRQFESYRADDDAKAARAKSAAVRMARILLRQGKAEGDAGSNTLASLHQLLVSQAWAHCRTEPSALVQALANRGVLSLSEDGGNIVYNENMIRCPLPSPESLPRTLQCEGTPIAATIDIDLGCNFLGRERAKQLRSRTGGLTRVAQTWIQSVCELCSLQGEPRIQITAEAAVVSFEFAPFCPQLASKVHDVARKDIEDQLNVQAFTIQVPAQSMFSHIHGRRAAGLQNKLNCIMSFNTQPQTHFTVVTTEKTAATKEQISEIIDLLFGEDSVFWCGAVTPETRGHVIRTLESQHPVHLQCDDGAVRSDEHVQVFACASIDPLNFIDPSQGISALRAFLAKLPGSVEEALQHTHDAAISRDKQCGPTESSPSSRACHDRLTTSMGQQPSEPRPPPTRTREYGAVDSFDDMDLEENLLRGIYSFGFERPSAIQQRGILPMVDGRDTICQAQSGTGKTCAFVAGVLQRIDFGVNVCQGLILAPTRELALQIHKVVLAFGEYLRVRAHACIGGTSVRGDIDRLREGQHVIVGMPGRVYDMISKRHLRVDHVFTLVLDEADLMLSGRLKDQVYDIFKTLPTSVAVSLFSATMPQETLEVSTRFMRDTVRILVRPEELLLEGTRNFYVAVDREEWKVDTLCDLYESLTTRQAIVYLRTRRKVDFVADQLTRRDFTVRALHAEFDQMERNLVMREFRAGSSRFLLTTDSFSRGIDVPQVSFVINYDMPADPATYLHRAGRCGRFGRTGVAISFISANDIPTLREVESCYSTQVEELPMDFADLL